MKNKIYKLLSIVLTVMLIFSCCSVGITALAEEVELAATYYISAAGNDETGTGENGAPFLTVGKAITQATTHGHNVAGKTVAIHVTNEANSTSVNMWGSVPEADCDLIIYADTAQTRLHNSSGGIELSGTGSITFKNIYASAKQYSSVSFGNKNVSVDSGSRLAPGDGGGYVSLGLFNTNSSTTTPLYFNMEGQSSAIYLCDPQSGRTFKNSLNITYDSANSQIFNFGCPRSKPDCVTTYTKPVNFNIKSANAVSFGTAIGSTRFTDGGLIQVINSSGKALTGLDNIVNAKLYTGEAAINATFEADNTPVTKWIINNTTTEYKDVLSFTDTAGIYDVAEGYSAVAVKADDNSVVVASAAPEGSQDVVLDLSKYEADTYNVTIEKLPEKVTYYIAAADSGGDSSNDGLSAATPLLTVNEAVTKAIEAGYNEKDTVILKTIGSTAISTGFTTREKILPAYPFKLVVTANDTSVPGEISDYFQLGGETDFSHVTITGEFGFDGFNSTFGEGAGFSSISKAVSSGKISNYYDSRAAAPTKIKIGTLNRNNFYFSSSYHSSMTYNHPLTIEIDNYVPYYGDIINGGFKFSNSQNTGTYNAPVNLKINGSTKPIPFYSTPSKVICGEKFAFQFINASDKALAKTDDVLSRNDGASDTHTSALDSLDPNKVYIITNTTGNDDLITFTDTVGTYKVNLNTERYNILVNGEIATVTDGCITVPSAGTYDITTSIKAINTEYYVEADATDGDGSEDAPFATIAEAINAANARELVAGDTLTVKVMGETAANWGTDAEAYTYLLKVVSNDTKTKATVIANQSLTGSVEFDYINVKSTRANESNPYRIFAAGYNVTLGSNATITDYFEIVTATSQATHTTQNIVINSNYAQTLLLGHSTSGYLKYTGDVNVTVNNTNASPTIKFLGHYGGNVTFNANLNLNFKDVKSFAVGDTSMTVASGTPDYTNGKRSGVASVNGAAQLLMPGDATVSNTSIANFKSLSSTYYIVRNNTGEELDFTATAGVYTVSGNDTIQIYKNGVKVGESADITIDLSELGAGEYVLVKVKTEATVFEYTNADGATIADMVAKAINNGAIEGDTLRITLTGTDAIEYGTPVAHLFDVEIVSAESTPVSFVENAILAGDTKFDGVKVSYPVGENTLWLGGHNVEMTAATTISGGDYLGLGAHNNSITIDTQTVKLDCAVPMYLILAGDNANITRTGALNVTLGHATTKPIISFGFHGTNTYADVNINLGTTTETSFKHVGDGTHVFTGDIKVIGENQLKDTTYLNSLSDNVYTVYNKTGIEGVLGFGDGAGTFIIDVDRGLYDVYLTDASGNKIKYDGNENEITLAPGDWELSKVRRPRYFEYTVSTDGEHKTIGAAINVANEAGLDEWDTLTVTVGGTEPVPWGGVENADLDQQLPAHDFKLIIKAADNTVKVGDKTTIILNGPTVFENITLNFNNSTSLLFDGNDVTIDSTVKFDSNMGFGLGKTRNRAVTANYYEPVNVDVNIPVKYLNISNNYHDANFHKDVNITYNASTGAPSFRFGCNRGATNINADLNFNIKAATGVNFINRGNGYNFGNDAKLQVINSSGVELASDTGELANIDVPKWIITNQTGKPDAISFTENAGTYNLDIGAIKQKGYYAIITNDNATNEVIHAKGDSVTLPAGEYTVTIGRDPQTKEYNITEGTLADAVQTAIDEGFGYGDNVTFNLGSLEEINIGKLPKYTFNLVIKSNDKTKLVMNESNEIANNQGAHTHFKNVEIYKVDLDKGGLGKWGTINLAGSSVTFDSDVVITTGGFCTLTYGVSADNNNAVVVDTEQKVVIDCPAPTYIALSSWNYANRTYNDDVTLVINNRDTDSTILFNAYYDKSPNGTTSYYGNININVKQAKGIKFQDFDETSLNGCVQLLINGNTVTREEDIAALNDFALQEMYYVIDKSFQRGILDFTDEVGVYAVNSEYEASASVKQTFDIYKRAFVDAENGDTATADENNVISIYNNDQYIDDENWMGTNVTNIWELRTNEYFEDFNDTTIDELHDDWMFSSDSSAVTAETELTDDGMLHIVTQHDVKEIPALNKNINISSKEQYISMDMKGNGFNDYNGLEILARLGGSGYAMDAYSFHLSSMFITLDKLNGNPNEKNVNRYYSYNTNGMETEANGLWGRVPGGVDKNNTYTFNSNHTYRVSLSVTTAYEGEKEIAYVRGIVVNLTTNQVVFDEVFKDKTPYDGTEFAICSPHHDSNVYIDNLYFSTEKFRDGDEGLVEGDINGDGVYNVLDLVYVGEKLDGTDHQIAVRNADLSGNGVIDEKDIPLIRKEILDGVKIGKEFNLSGNSDAAANALREQILGATSTLDGKVYKAYNNGEVVLTHEIKGSIWYVSDKATGTDNAGTKEDPWTLEELQANTILNNNEANSTYENCKVREGDAVLFERGSVFRTDNLLRDIVTSDQKTDSYSYLFMSEGTFYGAYTATKGANAGKTAKPKFIDSFKNYADAEWTAVAGQENLYVIDAHELIMDTEGNERVENGLYAADNGATNIVFNGGAKVGQRKAFPDSARNGGKLYTIYKDGQFTTDVVNGKLYLYSEVDPSTYDSIEVSRPVQAIQVNSHEGNVIIDNLSFHGFARGTIGSAYGTNGLTVTNCDIGYSGGTFMGKVRGGNAIGGWCGGSNYEIKHNWIYQTWDSAISPQGNQADSYDGFEVIGNLFEYNNCDIEIFDSGTGENVDESKSATWNNCDWSNNIMRFTTLGWGSREADKIRGIQGVIRGSFIDASVVDIDWTNNIIDSPGMEIFRLDNTTNYEQIADTTKALGIFKFGAEYAENGTAGDSLFGNNTYYLNARLRKTSVVVREYKTMTDDAYQAAHGSAEPISRGATTAAEFYNAITVVEDSTLWNKGVSHFFWGGVEVTSGN